MSSDRGSKSYVRPQQPQLMSNDETQNETDDKNVNTNDDEIKKLRFPHHRTAFDIVLDDLDVNETPWRSKQTPVRYYSKILSNHIYLPFIIYRLIYLIILIMVLMNIVGRYMQKDN